MGNLQRTLPSALQSPVCRKIESSMISHKPKRVTTQSDLTLVWPGVVFIRLHIGFVGCFPSFLEKLLSMSVGVMFAAAKS